MTREDRQGPELLAFQTAEQRPKRRSFQEQRHKYYEAKSAQDTPVPMHRPQGVHKECPSEIQLTRLLV